MRSVVYVIDTLSCDTAGTQKQLLETIRRFDGSNYVPSLVCLWESPWMSKTKLPCSVYSLGYQGFLKPNFPAVVRKLANLIDRTSADIVHTFFDEANIVGWMGVRASRRRPALVSSRRDMGLGSRNQPWYHHLFPTVLCVANRDFAAIVANCAAVADYASHRERTSRSKYVVLRNGVDLYCGNDCGPSATDTDKSGFEVAIVASLTPVKRHDVLLRAWAAFMVANHTPDARLHVVGAGPELDKLRDLVRRLEIERSVEFAGTRNDLGTWLPTQDVGVLCSDREGLSNAILEYMACGLPVVATRVGGNPELVDSTNGVLVPPDDVNAIQVALSALMKDPERRVQMGRASLERVHHGYSWDIAMARLSEFYGGLLP